MNALIKRPPYKTNTSYSEDRQILKGMTIENYERTHKTATIKYEPKL